MNLSNRFAGIGIGTKILLVVILFFVLFSLGLATLIGATSFNNLTQVKRAELERTSQILATQIAQMERNAALAARRFEESEPIVSELQLLTSLVHRQVLMFGFKRHAPCRLPHVGVRTGQITDPNS
ncbi:MAG: hypothetical protein AAF702_19085 [Chloroflexota bacterium]